MRRTLVVVLWLSVGGIAHAGPLVNGSFEEGFSGWELSSIYWGVTELTPLYGLAPEGHQQIVDVNNPFTQLGRHSWAAPSGGTEPVGGDRYAAFGTGNADYVGDQGPFDIYATQTFTLNKGDVLSGWSFFRNGDYMPQDSAYVKLFDTLGGQIAAPWLQTSGLTAYGGSIPYQSTGAWSQWAWTAPENGAYTLALGVTSMGDNYFDSWAFHDSITVPEPSTLLLLGSAVAGMMAARRRSTIPPS